MLGILLIIIGAVVMGLGMVMLTAWIGGRARWFDVGVYDRPGGSKVDRQFLDLYFVALVIAPLLGGAIAIVLGLSMAR